MIVREDIIQGSDEWKEVKWGKIGGTRAHSLLVDSDTLLIELLSEITEEFDPLEESFASEAMSRGILLEHEAREELSKYLGIELIQVGWLQSSENELLGISPDAMTKCMTISAEIKCPGSKRHVTTLLNDEIPRDNIRQSIHYFTVNPGLKKHYFCSFRPESNVRKIYVKEITRESKVDIGLTEKVKNIRPNPKGKDYEYTDTVPMIRTVQEWVDLSLSNSEKINQKLSEAIDKLSF